MNQTCQHLHLGLPASRADSARRQTSASQEEGTRQAPPQPVVDFPSPELRRVLLLFKPPACGTVLWQPKQTDTIGMRILLMGSQGPSPALSFYREGP